jgi:hypothetical protein
MTSKELFVFVDCIQNQHELDVDLTLNSLLKLMTIEELPIVGDAGIAGCEVDYIFLYLPMVLFHLSLQGLTISNSKSRQIFENLVTQLRILK